MENVPCNNCGGTGAEKAFACRDFYMGLAKGEYTVVRCGCGLFYINPRPDAEELRRYYPDAYYGRSGGLLNAVRGAILRAETRKFRGFLRAESSVLEIGCGTGDFPAAFKSAFGCSVSGVEPTGFAARLAGEKGVRMFDSPAAAAAAGPYDLVILKHVIEHLPDPVASLKEINEMMAPGGMLYLWLPLAGTPIQKLFGASWDGFDAPRHLYAYSMDTLRAALAKAGLEIVSVYGDYAPNPWVISLRGWLSGMGLPEWLWKLCDDEKNPLLLAAFFPLNAILALAGLGGRVKVLARRKQ
ncbi:MAG: class I SAM-dependent methyltransferase [Elusimicrobia bacterium]|nr:class I SAM-dependent methyltransferase [Elusimicrobiota bacterium]